MHLLDDVLYDRKSQTGAARFSRPCAIDAIEPLEDSGKIRRRDPDPRVRNSYATSAIAVHVRFDRYTASRAVEPHAVVEHVDQCLLQPAPVAIDGNVGKLATDQIDVVHAGFRLHRANG